jgi:hypothetical protein
MPNVLQTHPYIYIFTHPKTDFFSNRACPNELGFSSSTQPKTKVGACVKRTLK